LPQSKVVATNIWLHNFRINKISVGYLRSSVKAQSKPAFMTPVGLSAKRRAAAEGDGGVSGHVTPEDVIVMTGCRAR
jgi:hypothetical protein